MPIFYQTDYKTQQAELSLDYSPPQADLNEVKFIFWECKWENESSSSPQQSGRQVGLSPSQERASEILK